MFKPKFFDMNRRHFLAGMGATALGATAGIGQLRAQSMAPIDITTRRTSFAFDRPVTQGLVSLADNAPPPVLRMKQNQKAVINLTNGLDEYTTMHWHGLRIPNAMDGVPYLTQMPIAKDETFTYEFTPPDAGTYWYHPHCMTMEQMAYGLTGILIVEEEEDPGFDMDLPVNFKDFRIGDDGVLLPYFTARGAARGGTTGNVMTANWEMTPSYEVPTGGLVRLRLAVTDITRIHKLILPDLPGKIIAWNGHPVDEEIPWPTVNEPLWVGPGERVDIALRIPDEEGAEIHIQGLQFSQPTDLFTLKAVGSSLGRDLAELKPLPKNPVTEPDLAEAETEEVLFGWTPDGGGSDNGYCGTFEYTFWSINRKPWPGDAVEGTGPVVDLKQGKSYVLRLRNESPNLHPIHLHGLAFKPIKSNLRKLPANYTDTVLLLKDEVVDIALVADNPGDWAFHCHVIEHQKSGLAGYVRVS